MAATTHLRRRRTSSRDGLHCARTGGGQTPHSIHIRGRFTGRPPGRCGPARRERPLQLRYGRSLASRATTTNGGDKVPRSALRASDDAGTLGECCGRSPLLPLLDLARYSIIENKGPVDSEHDPARRLAPSDLPSRRICRAFDEHARLQEQPRRQNGTNGIPGGYALFEKALSITWDTTAPPEEHPSRKDAIELASRDPHLFRRGEFVPSAFDEHSLGVPLVAPPDVFLV